MAVAIDSLLWICVEFFTVEEGGQLSKTHAMDMARCNVLKTSKHANPVTMSVHTLLANRHTASASDICVTVHKMCNKGQPCWKRSGSCWERSGQSASNSGLNALNAWSFKHAPSHAENIADILTGSALGTLTFRACYNGSWPHGHVMPSPCVVSIIGGIGPLPGITNNCSVKYSNYLSYQLAN